MRKQSIVLMVLLIALTVFLSACTTTTDGATKVEDSEVQRPDNVDFGTSEVDWRNYELTDIDGNSFEIGDFDDKPVFVETFAIWCSNCDKQQGYVTQLHKDLGDDVVTIAIEIDPNAKISDVVEHKADHEFKSQYVVAPQEFTQSLVDEFGAGIVSAPSVPMLYICGDEVTFLKRGLKPVSELKRLAGECNA